MSLCFKTITLYPLTLYHSLVVTVVSRSNITMFYMYVNSSRKTFIVIYNKPNLVQTYLIENPEFAEMRHGVVILTVQ